MRHLRRAIVCHTHCDPDDEREMVDDLADVDCQECLDAYREREAQWHTDIQEGKRLKTGPVPKVDPDDGTDTTAPGKRRK